MFCTNCGKEVNEGEKFCSNCGASIGTNHTENNVNPEFDVILINIGSNQASVIKTIREITGLGLKDVQKIIDNLPKAIKQNVVKEEAENMKARLSEIGAIAELQDSVNKSNNTMENKTEMKKESKQNSKKKIFSIFGIVLVILIGIGYATNHQNTNAIPTSTSEISMNNKVENNEQNFEDGEYEPKEDIEQDVWDGDTEQDFWDNETRAYIEANQERTGGEETQEPTTNNNDKSFTSRDEIFDNVKVHEEDITKNNNSTQQYYDDDYLKLIGFEKCLDEDVSIKSAYNSGQCVHAEEVTKNSDGSVSVHVKLYIKEAYEYSRMYGMPLSEIASADVTLTKEEATR